MRGIFFYRISSVMIMVEGFAQRLAKIRTAKGLSKNALGSLAGVSGSMIGRYESGERQPTLEVLIKLASTLNVTTDNLLGVEKNQNGKPEILMDVTGLTIKQIESVQTIVDECKILNKTET